MGSTIHRTSIYLVVLVSMALPAAAFPCERHDHPIECSIINLLPLADEEQEALIGTMLSNPLNWNLNLPHLSTPPEGTLVTNNEIVKNAWVHIMAVQPSVYENVTLLSPGYGTVITRSHYDTQLPRKTEPGDCKTRYKLSTQSWTENYLNNQFIGHSESASFETRATTLLFQTRLVIQTSLEVKHYKWRRINKRQVCTYAFTEVRNDETIIIDELSAQRHEPTKTFTFNITANNSGTHEITFTATNYSWLRIQFNPESYYEERKHSLRPVFNHKPYYALQYRIYDVNATSSRNARSFDNRTIFYVALLDNCSITVADYFRSTTSPCPIINPEPLPNIITPLNPFKSRNAWKQALTLTSIAAIVYVFWKAIKHITGELYAL